MEISEKLVKFKVPILVALGSCVVVSTLVLVVAPRFVTIVTYFWPLFVSTALFLVAVVVFGRSTPIAGDSAGEGLLDYVAGEPDHLHHHVLNHDHHHDLIESDDDDDEHELVEGSSSKNVT